jgi:hypothetical protein
MLNADFVAYTAVFDPGALIDPESEIPPDDAQSTGPLETWLLKFEARSVGELKSNDRVVFAEADCAPNRLMTVNVATLRERQTECFNTKILSKSLTYAIAI